MKTYKNKTASKIAMLFLITSGSQSSYASRFLKSAEEAAEKELSQLAETTESQAEKAAKKSVSFAQEATVYTDPKWKTAADVSKGEKATSIITSDEQEQVFATEATRMDEKQYTTEATKGALSIADKISLFIDYLTEKISALFSQQETIASETPAQLNVTIKSTITSTLDSLIASDTVNLEEEILSGEAFKTLKTQWLDLLTNTSWKEIKQDTLVQKICGGSEKTTVLNILKNWDVISSLLNSENDTMKTLIENVNTIIATTKTINNSLKTTTEALTGALDNNPVIHDASSLIPNGSAVLEQTVMSTLEAFFNLDPKLLATISQTLNI